METSLTRVTRRVETKTKRGSKLACRNTRRSRAKRFSSLTNPLFLLSLPGFLFPCSSLSRHFGCHVVHWDARRWKARTEKSLPRGGGRTSKNRRCTIDNEHYIAGTLPNIGRVTRNRDRLGRRINFLEIRARDHRFTRLLITRGGRSKDLRISF